MGAALGGTDLFGGHGSGSGTKRVEGVEADDAIHVTRGQVVTIP